MSTAGRDMLWVRQLVRDVQIPARKIPMIGTDSRNAMLAAEGDRQNMSTRHTDVRYKWIKERIQKGELTLRWIETSQMKADGLTKALNTVQQARFVGLIGLSEVIDKEHKIESCDAIEKNPGNRATPTNQEVSLLVWKNGPRQREKEYRDAMKEDPESDGSITYGPEA